ncbi:MAG: helix-turn-helix transcriptional regulator [Rhizomicrobium sp.]
MASSRQIRAARALLGWTQQALADRALVAINTVRAIERDRPYPKDDTIEAVVRALEKSGISFLSDGPLGEGVRLRPRGNRLKT